MSRQLPEKPNLEFLKKEAKELRRVLPYGNLADAQHALANEYGFPSWAKLKAHVEAQSLTPAFALTAAVRASDASRVRELLARHGDLRARIDAPLENYGDGQHALNKRNNRVKSCQPLRFGPFGRLKNKICDRSTGSTAKQLPHTRAISE